MLKSQCFTVKRGHFDLKSQCFATKKGVIFKLEYKDGYHFFQWVRELRCQTTLCKQVICGCVSTVHKEQLGHCVPVYVPVWVQYAAPTLMTYGGLTGHQGHLRPLISIQPNLIPGLVL